MKCFLNGIAASAFDKVPPTRFAEELAVSIDQTAAGEDSHRIALEFHPFPNGVIDPGMHIGLRDYKTFGRIVHHDVGVGADRDGPFLRRATEDLRRIGGADLDRFTEGDSAAVGRAQHVRVKVFNAHAAIGDFREVILAIVLFERLKRTMIGRHRHDVAAPDPFPKRRPAFRAFDRRGADKIPAVRPLIHFLGEMQILRASLGVNGLTFVPRLGDLGQSFGAGQMDNV